MLNKVILIGKMGFNPEIKSFNNGNMYSILKIVTENKNNIDENKKSSDWHRIVLYNHLAQYSKNFLKKGDIVFVEGKIKTRRWMDDFNKKYNYITEIIASELKIINKYKYENKNFNNLDNNKDILKNEEIRYDSDTNNLNYDDINNDNYNFENLDDLESKFDKSELDLEDNFDDLEDEI